MALQVPRQLWSPIAVLVTLETHLVSLPTHPLIVIGVRQTAILILIWMWLPFKTCVEALIKGTVNSILQYL